ncbi:MAG: glycosyltransferase family 8 protein [Lachnospiraceae bacterium]|nr:glycosyltransferase family 8 protein [Lachnospiraceae bacterium]
MKLDILYQFNEKYAPFAGASLTSLLENNRHFDQIRIFILGEGLSKLSEQRFRTLTANYGRHMSFVNTDSLLHMMRGLSMPAYRGSYAANMRLFISYVLPDDVDRILYLDADTIVTGKLDSLAELPMEDHPLAMALDSLVRMHKKRLGFQKDDYYYNSGVILFSMETWRRDRCSERIANHVKNVRAWYASPDQDLLNVVLKGEILRLPAKYNIQPVYLAFPLKSYLRTFGSRGFYSYGEIRESLENPVIYHFFRFVGEFPWNRDNLHPDNDLFDAYLALSPWKGYEKQKARGGITFKFEKFLYKRLPKWIFIKIFRVAYEDFIRKANRDSLKFKTNRHM